ncbi:tetratricopeptide repeat protein [Marinoscillum furvescens]|nr:tetratricopeptide repeat protein [Marinoscillum furvescens]
MQKPLLFGCLIFTFLSGCLETQSSKGQDSPPLTQPVVEPQEEDPNQVTSLLGTALPEKALPAKVKQRRQAQLDEARQKYERTPDSLENIIWYGRRLAYLGRYNEAIHLYSVGLDLFPDSYRLLRHRGHRYITVRKFGEAIEDLQRAAFYARPAANAIEKDGLPNRLNKPLSNTKFNIWYHLGVAYYLKGNYDKAISAFKKCMTFANNDDLMVATTNWFHLTYRKIGNQEAADQLLQKIHRRMDIIENYSYHQQLLLFKGVYTDKTLLERAEQENNALNPTLSYGIASWHIFNGNIPEGKNILERILLSPNWDSFGYIAAEADMLSLSNL